MKNGIKPLGGNSAKIVVVPNCSQVKVTLEVVGGKWKPLILFVLKDGRKRFGEIYRSIEGVTQKMLTQQLRQLESDGLITRKIYPEIPPRVEYTLTTYGKTLEPVLKSMSQWGERHATRKSAYFNVDSQHK